MEHQIYENVSQNIIYILKFALINFHHVHINGSSMDVLTINDSTLYIQVDMNSYLSYTPSPLL